MTRREEWIRLVAASITAGVVVEDAYAEASRVLDEADRRFGEPHNEARILPQTQTGRQW